ncbi:MAG: hypothetical protein GC154_21090 [bacterium]|nr:hypothetical protein [bacterium]
MDVFLIEEEEISLLGKMLYYSASHLTKREREVYDHLIENLLRKVSQVRQRERAAQADMEAHGDAQLTAKKNAIRSLRPEEVCKTFVDSWNKQDFETEYFCMSQSFPIHKKKTDNVREYVINRMKKYQDRLNVGPITKRVMEVSFAETHGNKTAVYCIEVHKMPDKNLTMHREYELIYEDGAWRIADFETVKSHESPITSKPSAS